MIIFKKYYIVLRSMVISNIQQVTIQIIPGWFIFAAFMSASERWSLPGKPGVSQM